MKLKTGFIISQASIIICLIVTLVGGLFLYQQSQLSKQTDQHLLQYKNAFTRFLYLQPAFSLYRSKDIESELKKLKHNYALAIMSLKQRIEDDDIALLLLNQIQVGVGEFEKNLLEQIKLQRRLGFNEDRGLRGFFRHAVHELQTITEKLEDAEFEILILELRRREKDYLLRWDPKYLTLHTKLIAQTQRLINIRYPEKSADLNLRLNEYAQGFSQYIYHLETQGQFASQGLKGKNNTLSVELGERFDTLYQHLNEQQAATSQNYLRKIFLLILATTIISLSVSFVINRRVTFSLIAVTAFIRKLSKNDDFSERLELGGNDELSQFSDDLGILLSHIETLIERLSLAQSRLIEDAKMASLGGLVKGFAHELNTPLGVAITSESFLREKVGKLKNDFKQGKISKANLQVLLQEFDDSLNLIESNLTRSAELISSFKQVASHQEYDELVEFDIHEFLDNLVISLRHEIDKHDASISLDMPKGMIIKSYLGAFGQIFTIFIVNSLRHGQVEDRLLNIEISCKFVSGAIHFRFSDDGAGIKEELLEKVFEPFVTTKRGEGGTGLGLSIVYNLVTQRLGGHIELQSIEGKGICIYMHFNDIPFRQHFD
ncbi:sensor histidine kinase [Pseudoalteromonas sp. MTN2-4]|uniref:sensor histidine kinase n=1 Tax=Pseudoalteromonas sp. MTN2-4 TaxID=3056555 RepID=UPI0036F19E54